MRHLLSGARLNTSVSPVADLGDGRYRFSLSSSLRVGTDTFAITAEDGRVRATLYPYLEVRSEPPTALHVGIDRLSASAGGTAPFVLALPGFEGARYLVLGSASGSTPPTWIRGVWLPLVRDPWFTLTRQFAGDARYLPGTRGVLDRMGRAEAALVAPPGVLVSLIGRRLSWAAFAVSGARAVATEAVSFEIVP